jgi:hypothetical protein
MFQLNGLRISGVGAQPLIDGDVFLVLWSSCGTKKYVLVHENEKIM